MIEYSNEQSNLIDKLQEFMENILNIKIFECKVI